MFANKRKVSKPYRAPFKKGPKKAPILLRNTRLQNDEKKEQRPAIDTQSVVSLSRSIFSASSLSDKVFRVNAGFRTGIATSGASVMVFSVPTGPVLNAALGSTIVPEFSALITLFDEYKVSGISYQYDPVNPFNRGAVTVSFPIALFWDDVDATLVPTNSNAGMGAAAMRGRQYHTFSPDIPCRGEFTRASSTNYYDWTPVLLPGSEPSSAGGLYVVGDGNNTATVTYGYLTYWFHCQFRMRQ